jgi:hypothetical protein
MAFCVATKKKACCSKEGDNSSTIAFFAAIIPNEKQIEEKGVREGIYLQALVLSPA